jgi:putative hydrolase of the HAD superfamily
MPRNAPDPGNRTDVSAPPHATLSQVRVVLFDVGGVLVKLSGIDIMLDWLGHTMTPEEMWRRWLGSETVRRFETGRIDAWAFATGVTSEFDLPIPPQQFLDSFMNWPMELYPGTSDMLSRIPDSYRCALLSNSNALHWPRIVTDLNLGGLVDNHFVSHLTGRIKPDADAFAHVVEALECRPPEVLFLDDNRINVDAAEQFGMHSTLVLGSHEAQRALVEFGIIQNEKS